MKIYARTDFPTPTDVISRNEMNRHTCPVDPEEARTRSGPFQKFWFPPKPNSSIFRQFLVVIHLVLKRIDLRRAKEVQHLSSSSNYTISKVNRSWQLESFSRNSPVVSLISVTFRSIVFNFRLELIYYVWTITS